MAKQTDQDSNPYSKPRSGEGQPGQRQRLALELGVMVHTYNPKTFKEQQLCDYWEIPCQ